MNIDTKHLYSNGLSADLTIAQVKLDLALEVEHLERYVDYADEDHVREIDSLIKQWELNQE